MRRFFMSFKTLLALRLAEYTRQYLHDVPTDTFIVHHGTYVHDDEFECLSESNLEMLHCSGAQHFLFVCNESLANVAT